MAHTLRHYFKAGADPLPCCSDAAGCRVDLSPWERQLSPPQWSHQDDGEGGLELGAEAGAETRPRSPSFCAAMERFAGSGLCW